jgi:hypothetical protein
MHGNWGKLTEGLCVNGRGAAHLRLGELLRAALYQDNEMNRETPQRAAVEMSGHPLCRPPTSDLPCWGNGPAGAARKVGGPAICRSAHARL